jgi:hypothetical protein
MPTALYLPPSIWIIHLLDGVYDDNVRVLGACQGAGVLYGIADFDACVPDDLDGYLTMEFLIPGPPDIRKSTVSRN